MATTRYSLDELIFKFDKKLAEEQDKLDNLLCSDVSENTKKTQKYQRTKEMEKLQVIKELLEVYETRTLDEEITLDSYFDKIIASMVTLTSERKAANEIIVHEGDLVMDLLTKYENKKDIYKKLMKAADEAGLKADFVQGKFVKK